MTQDSSEKAPVEEKPEQVEEAETPSITFKDFLKVDLRVAQILEAERIEKSEKLVKLQVSVGEKLGTRQIVAGIAKHYPAEDLVGRKIVIVANLKPAKLMGELSEGMLLAASDDENRLELISPGDVLPAGSSVG